MIKSVSLFDEVRYNVIEESSITGRKFFVGGEAVRKRKTDWSVLRYLAYFSQVGITAITPPLFLCFGANWLKNRFDLGNGIMIVGILLGIAVSVCGLRDFLRFTERQARKRDEEDPYT